MKKVQRVTLISMFSSLSILFSILNLEFPYPILPYLKFDLTEIPPAVALVTNGLSDSIIVSTIYFLFLLFKGEFSPFGPIAKYLAILSTSLGIWIAIRKDISFKSLINGTVLATLIRVTAMTGLNIIILQLFLTSLLNVLNNMGLTFYSVIIYTSIFNVLQILITLFPLYVLLPKINKFLTLTNK